MGETVKEDLSLVSKSRLPFEAIETVVWILGVLSITFSIYATSLGFHNSLFDFHGFRQTQTAISAESILHGGGFLRYDTPVLGPPWSLPFEFPLYQAIVAGLAQIFSTPLDQTGRLVSISFYYLCFFPLASILSSLGMRGVQMVPPLALFAVSPIYIFISRLFMIESTALFFSLLYADQMFRLVLGGRRWQPRNIAGCAVFGVLAGLVKVTTFAPFFALGACLVAWALWKDFKRGQFAVNLCTKVVLCSLALPVGATLLWTRFTDNVRAQNPIGIYLVSKELHAWTFGTIGQRLHPRIYLQLWNAANNHVGNIWAVVIVLAIYSWLFRRWNPIAGACLSLYIGTILTFFNLHVVHEYYPYANAVFLVVAVGVLIAAIIRIPGQRGWIGVALMVLMMVGCGSRYLVHYYPIQIRNAPGRPQAVALVDGVSAPGSVILIEGLEWSAEFPYQSHRRAIMDAFFPETPTWGTGPVEQAIANEGSINVTALVACDQGRYGPRLSTFLRDLRLAETTRLHADNCDIYARMPASVDTVQTP